MAGPGTAICSNFSGVDHFADGWKKLWRQTLKQGLSSFRWAGWALNQKWRPTVVKDLTQCIKTVVEDASSIDCSFVNPNNVKSCLAFHFLGWMNQKGCLDRLTKEHNTQLVNQYWFFGCRKYDRFVQLRAVFLRCMRGCSATPKKCIKKSPVDKGYRPNK